MPRSRSRLGSADEAIARDTQMAAANGAVVAVKPVSERPAKASSTRRTKSRRVKRK